MSESLVVDAEVKECEVLSDYFDEFQNANNYGTVRPDRVVIVDAERNKLPSSLLQSSSHLHANAKQFHGANSNGLIVHYPT